MICLYSLNDDMSILIDDICLYEDGLLIDGFDDCLIDGLMDGFIDKWMGLSMD